MKRAHPSRHRRLVITTAMLAALPLAACGENPHLIRKKTGSTATATSESGGATSGTDDAGSSSSAAPATGADGGFTSWNGGDSESTGSGNPSGAIDPSAQSPIFAPDSAAIAATPPSATATDGLVTSDSSSSSVGDSSNIDSTLVTGSDAVTPTPTPAATSVAAPTPVDETPPATLAIDTENFLAEMDSEPPSERDQGETPVLFLNTDSAAAGKATRAFSAPPLRTAKGFGFANGTNITFRFLLDLPPRDSVRSIQEFKIGFKNLRRVVDAAETPTDAIKMKGQVLCLLDTRVCSGDPSSEQATNLNPTFWTSQTRVATSVFSESGLDNLVETLPGGSQLKAKTNTVFNAAELFGIPSEKLLDFLYENAVPTAANGLRKIRLAVANRTIFDRASIRIKLDLVPKTLEQQPSDALAQLERLDPKDVSISLQTEETITIVKVFSDLHLTMTNNTLRFESGSNAVGADAAEKLKRTADVLRSTSFRQILIDGHADKTGKASSNLTLSKNRAQAVADILAGAGIDRATLTVTGYGSSRPLDTASTRTAYAKNRRVEITIHGLLDADSTQAELVKIWNFSSGGGGAVTGGPSQ